MDLPIEIALKHPFEVGDETVDKLIINRRPKAKDLKAMDQESGDIAKSACLLATLAEVPTVYVDQMDARDFMRAAEIVGSFLD